MNENSNKIPISDLIALGFNEELWNAELGISLIQSNDGYFPKFLPPLVEREIDRVIQKNGHGRRVTDLESLKALLEYVKQNRSLQ